MSDNIDKILEEKLAFYKQLQQKHKEDLIKSSRVLKIEKNRLITLERDNIEGIVIVLSGELKNFMNYRDKEIKLFNLYEYDICILSSATNYSNLPCSTNLKTIKDSEVLIIEGEVFKNISSENLEAQKFLNTLTQSKLSEVMNTLIEVNFYSMENRVIKYLVNEFEYSNDLIVNVTHEDIANDLGTAREVISRILKKLDNRDLIIQPQRGKIEIVDIKKLKNIIEELN